MRELEFSLSGKSARHWAFVEGIWSQNRNGIITAPRTLDDRNLAIYTANAFADFEAEFEFRWDLPWTNAGFVFGARDAQHYHVLNFPVVGQHYRRAHFWAAISRVDESGFASVVSNNGRMEQVAGVASEIGLWHTVRLVVDGKHARVWVDGRPLATAIDDAFCDPGYVGLMTYASLAAGDKASFRNVRIKGRATPAPPWDDSIRPRRNWFVVTDTCGASCSNIVRAANGDLLVTCETGLLRSTDNGRTWRDPEAFPFAANMVYPDPLHVRRNGQVLVTRFQTESPHTISKATSDDHGRTWSPVDASTRLDVPETAGDVWLTGTGLVLKDGTMVWFVLIPDEPGDNGRPGYAGCIRSADEGRTWSTPIPIDGPGPMPQHPMKDKDVNSETAGAETRDGKIVAFVRNSEPTMWECWSEDGGLTWLPAARGPFPSYAGFCSMLTTSSGVIVFGGRFPGIGIQASYDDGMTWRCTETDSATWAQGGMIEVEPDVVLHIYGGPDNPRQLRGQLLRVTPEGLEAVFD